MALIKYAANEFLQSRLNEVKQQLASPDLAQEEKQALIEERFAIEELISGEKKFPQVAAPNIQSMLSNVPEEPATQLHTLLDTCNEILNKVEDDDVRREVAMVIDRLSEAITTYDDNMDDLNQRINQIVEPYLERIEAWKNQYLYEAVEEETV